MIKVAIEDLEKNIPFIVKHIEAGDHFLILKGQKPTKQSHTPNC